jgi:hypothetical protein
VATPAADTPRIAVPPIREPVIAADNAAQDFDIELPPCCHIVGEAHPDRHPEEAPPILVGAKVTNRDERGLEAAVELPFPAEAGLVDAIGIPMTAQRGVSQPSHRPVSAALKAWAELAAPVLLLLLAIASWRRWRRRSRALEDPTAPQPRLPDVLMRLVETPVPVLEPITAPAKERELEPS